MMGRPVLLNRSAHLSKSWWDYVGLLIHHVMASRNPGFFGTSQVWWIMADHYESLADQIGKVHQSTKENQNISDSICLKNFENRLIIKTHWFIIILPSFSQKNGHLRCAAPSAGHSRPTSQHRSRRPSVLLRHFDTWGRLWDAQGIMIFPFTVHDLGIMII